MPITITVGEKEEESAAAQSAPTKEEVNNLPLTMNLDLRKAVDGSLMIFDHPEIDIVVVPATDKIVTFPKESYKDEVYDSQDRLFKHLLKAGLVTPGTVQGGNVHGALGGTILPATNPEFPVTDLVVLSIGKFIEREKPDYLFADAYDKEVDEMYVEPTDDDSTPLGKVPQAVKKGSIQPYDARRYLTGVY